MKVSKESLKHVFNRKESYISISLLVVCVFFFILSYFQFVNTYKGIRDFSSSEKIEKVFTNNSSIVYAVGENNNVYYSFNKKYKGHLNTFSKIETLDNEYGDATNYYYNFIKIEYNFAHKIIKIDGFRDDSNGENGYTLILDEIGNLYAIYDGFKNVVVIDKNIKNFDVGYDSFTVVYYDGLLAEFIKVNNNFYRYAISNELFEKKIKLVSTQGYRFIDVQVNGYETKERSYNSYLVDENNQLYNSKIIVDFDTILNYEIQDTDTPYVKNILGLSHDVSKIDKSLYNNEQILQIESIEKTSIVLTDTSLYGIGDSYWYEYEGIFGKKTYVTDILMHKINHNISNIEYITLSGPFALIIKNDEGFYYTGNLDGSNVYEFTKYNKIKNADYLIATYSSVIIIKNQVIYYQEDGKIYNMFDHRLRVSIMRYLSIFLIVMDILYISMMFIDETKKYNRYKKIEVLK